ncbi:hypothetical protein ACF0H5_023688 [Mactra antiquata]
MTLVLGNSHVKYMSEYLSKDDYSVFAYPGYRVRDFLNESVIFEVVPFFSKVVVGGGANDIGYKAPHRIISDIQLLCDRIHSDSPR